MWKRKLIIRETDLIQVEADPIPFPDWNDEWNHWCFAEGIALCSLQNHLLWGGSVSPLDPELLQLHHPPSSSRLQQEKLTLNQREANPRRRGSWWRYERGAALVMMWLCKFKGKYFLQQASSKVEVVQGESLKSPGQQQKTRQKTLPNVLVPCWKIKVKGASALEALEQRQNFLEQSVKLFKPIISAVNWRNNNNNFIEREGKGKGEKWSKIFCQIQVTPTSQSAD